MSVNVEQLKIVKYPDQVLKQMAQPIDAVTEEVQAIVRKMLVLMHEANGVGLAAPQVGLPLRMFVANASGDEMKDKVYINPRIVAAEGPDEPYDEGCLSLPGVEVQMVRPTKVTIMATDIQGKLFEESAEDLWARVWQHENDHLNGKLIIDKMGAIDRMLNRKPLRELEAKFKAQL